MLSIFRLLRRPQIIQLTQLNYVTHNKSYYDILGISKDATKQEIRAAFIKLSKETHPDTSKKADKKNHNDFVVINEAYNVLSKDSSRYRYDQDLKYNNSPNHYQPYNQESSYYHGYAGSSDNSPGSNYENTNRTDGYYGVHGINKMHNTTLVLCCIVFTLAGVIFQIFAICYSRTFYRAKLKNKSDEYEEEYRIIRNSARNISHDDAIRLLERRYKRQQGQPNVES